MSGLPASVARQIASELGAPLGHSRVVRGGDIHSAFQVELAQGGELFVKTSPKTAPGLFAAEAAGLAWLAQHGAPTPEVVAWADQRGEEPGWLALRWLESGGRHQGRALGEALARLHGQKMAAPGWDRPCFIGPLPQDNRTVETAGHEGIGAVWAQFWADRRLRPMAKQAGAALGREGLRLIEAVCDRCPTLLGDLPSLAPLHGDLWGGNVLWSEGGPVLIDPAVYAGDPEVDLAMMALFGGFDAQVWSAYHGLHPRRAGFEVRQALYQLWPLLVHLVLFGGGYRAGVVANAQRVVAACR